MKALDLLIKLQSAYYKPIVHSEKFDQEFDYIFKKMLGNSYESVIVKYNEKKNKLLTEYEDLHLMGLIEYSFDMFKEILDTKKFAIEDKILNHSSEFPFYGTIRNNSFKSLILSTDDVPLIIFSEGMMKLANSI